MSMLDMDLDLRMSQLEAEWRQAYEMSIAARIEYQALAAKVGAKAALLDVAQEQLDRAEALKARVMHQIERLECEVLGKG